MKHSFISIHVFALAALLLGCGLAPGPRAGASSATPGAPAAAATPARTPDARLYGRNLLAGADAEAGNGDGWTNAGDLKTIGYGEWGGGPTKEAPGSVSRGEKYFYAHVDDVHPSVGFTQRFEVAGIATDVDAGAVECDFGGWFGGVNTSQTSARLKVAFFGADGKPLRGAETEEVKPVDRAEDDYRLVERRRRVAVPAGTRRIEAVLEFYFLEGRNPEILEGDSFADEVSLRLTKKEASK